MRYLCQVYYDEQRLNALSEGELQTLINEALDYDDELHKGGHYLASAALQEVGSAATIRPQSGELLITDGPFAETKEQLGGFILIEARDMNEAIRLASNMPPARLGCIEVRPVKELTRG